MDKEYESFLTEIGGGGDDFGFSSSGGGGGGGGGGAKSSADDEYASFMASIGESTHSPRPQSPLRANRVVDPFRFSLCAAPTSPQAEAASAPAPWAKPRAAPAAPPAALESPRGGMGGGGAGHYGPGPMHARGGPMPPAMGGGRGGYPPAGGYPQQGIHAAPPFFRHKHVE
jgi:hypothetical protein